MSRKIMILHPWGVGYMDSKAIEAAAPFVRSDTEVACTNLGDGAPPLPLPLPGYEGLAVEKALKAEAEGFDAIVVGCCADPFLDEIKAAVSIPATGLSEATLRSAHSRGKMAILVRNLGDAYLPMIPSQNDWGFWRNLGATYGLSEGEHYSLREVMVPKHPDPRELERLTVEDPAKLADLTIEAMTDALYENGLPEAEKAFADDGVKSVFFACAFWGQAIAQLQRNGHHLGGKIVNPLVSGVTYAEQMVLASA
ncbi:aspartate/glutamate racemase family protein [Rhodococcus erythropolis]